jgi:hypothetical protein
LSSPEGKSLCVISGQPGGFGGEDIHATTRITPGLGVGFYYDNVTADPITSQEPTIRIGFEVPRSAQRRAVLLCANLVLTEKLTIFLGLSSGIVYKNKSCVDRYRSK